MCTDNIERESLLTNLMNTPMNLQSKYAVRVMKRDDEWADIISMLQRERPKFCTGGTVFESRSGFLLL